MDNQIRYDLLKEEIIVAEERLVNRIQIIFLALIALAVLVMREEISIEIKNILGYLELSLTPILGCISFFLIGVVFLLCSALVILLFTDFFASKIIRKISLSERRRMNKLENEALKRIS